MARRTGLQLAVVDQVFQFVSVLGLLLALGFSARRWIPFSFLTLLVPIAFQYDIGVLERWKQTGQLFPLFVFGALVSMGVGLDLLRRAWERLGAVRSQAYQGVSPVDG